MRLTYETGTATFIQFATMGLLNLGTGLEAVITACRAENQSCGDNILSSVVFYILVVMWFGLVSVIGYGAQETRSKRLLKTLIAAELLIAFVAFWNARHFPTYISLITSLADLLLAIWIIYLAFRVLRRGGGRVVSRHRVRQRRSA